MERINFIGRDEETITKMVFIYTIALKIEKGIDEEGIPTEIEDEVNRVADMLLEFKVDNYPDEEIDSNGISEFMTELLFNRFSQEIIQETFELMM
jgi:hypothetical protein